MPLGVSGPGLMLLVWAFRGAGGEGEGHGR